MGNPIESSFFILCANWLDKDAGIAKEDWLARKPKVMIRFCIIIGTRRYREFPGPAEWLRQFLLLSGCKSKVCMEDQPPESAFHHSGKSWPSRQLSR